MRITTQGKIFDESKNELGSCFISGKHVFTCCHVVTLSKSPIHLKVLRPYSFEVPLGNEVKVFDELDLVMFTLECAPLPNVDYKPTLVNRKHFRQLDIQIYLEDRNWINCSILGFAGNGLTAKLAPCPHRIEEGDSGSPVWHNDHVIGILKQKFGNGDAEIAIQPFNEDMLKKIEFAALSFKNFAIPRDYLRNKEFYFDIRNALDSIEKKPVVIFGLSGTGKTDLAHDIGNSFKRVVFLGNTNNNIEEKENEILTCELLIVRNYTGQEEIDSLIKLCSSNLLVTISSPMGLGKFRNTFGDVSQFDMPELLDHQCNYLLKGIDDQLAKQRITSLTKIPFLLRLFRDVFIEFKNMKVDSEFDFENSNKELEFDLIERWFQEVCQNDPVMREILALLSVSYYGLDLQSLLLVLGIDREIGESKLELLRDRGHLVIDKVPNSSDRIIYLHERIKSALRNMNLPVQEEIVESYFSFLGNPNRPDTPLTTKVDVLVTKMKSMWEKLNNKSMDGRAFTRDCIEFSQRLEELLPKGVISERESLWIRDRFGSCVSGYCTEIIPIASIVSQFPPQALFAEMLFEGAFKNIYDDEKSSDSARAHLIYASVHHWSGTSGFQRQTAIDKLENYFLRDLCILKDSKSIDVEVASVLGGICFLGGIEVAIRLVQSDKYRNSYQRSDVGILTLIASILKDQTTDSNVIRTLIRDHSSKISESVAKNDIKEYLNHLGLESSFDSSNHICDGITISGQKADSSMLCRTISLASRNTELDNYLITQKQRQGTLLLTTR